MTMVTNTGHGARVWQFQNFTLLKLPKSESSFKSGAGAKGRGFHLAMQPNEELTRCIHILFIPHLIYWKCCIMAWLQRQPNLDLQSANEAGLEAAERDR